MIINKEDVFELTINSPEISLWKFLMKEKTRTAFLTLLNEICSDFVGRGYLCTNLVFLDQLGDAFTEATPDTPNHQQLLGIFQKLSLKPQVQQLIIRKEILQQTFIILNNLSASISDYSLEYMLALIINLSMSPLVRRIYENDPNCTHLTILLKYWEICPFDIRQYLNGAIYSLVSNPKVQNRCKEIRVEEQLKVGLDSLSENCQKQVKHIFEKINHNNLEDTILTFADTKDPENLTIEMIDYICKTESIKLIKDNDIFRTYQLDQIEKGSKEQTDLIMLHFDAFFEDPSEHLTNFDVTEALAFKNGDESIMSHRYSHFSKPVTPLTIKEKGNVFTYSPVSESKSPAVIEKILKQVSEISEGMDLLLSDQMNSETVFKAKPKIKRSPENKE